MEINTVSARYDGTPIPHVNSADYPGPPWKTEVPSLEIYAWRGERMLSKSAWKGKRFQCIWANMANVTIQYDFGAIIYYSEAIHKGWIFQRWEGPR